MVSLILCILAQSRLPKYLVVILGGKYLLAIYRDNINKKF